MLTFVLILMLTPAQLSALHDSVTSSFEARFSAAVEAKEQEIEELRGEAQRLSDKQFKSANINKKLQEKNKVLFMIS